MTSLQFSILLVRRDKWLRGEGPIYGMCDSNRSKVCLIGMLFLQAGITPAAIRGCCDPADVFARTGVFLVELFDGDGSVSGWVYDIMAVNDDESLTEARREQAILEICLGQGIDVVFS